MDIVGIDLAKPSQSVLEEAQEKLNEGLDRASMMVDLEFDVHTQMYAFSRFWSETVFVTAGTLDAECVRIGGASFGEVDSESIGLGLYAHLCRSEELRHFLLEEVSRLRLREKVPGGRCSHFPGHFV